MNFATGCLVSIERRDRKMLVARKIWRLNVKPLEQRLVN
jgi:hypothetical protein